MRVLIISGSYSPDKCGVGDYTRHLAETLATKSGVEVAVLTGVGVSQNEASLVRLYRVMPDWRFRNWHFIHRVILEFKPDVVHVQYPTQGYRGHQPKFLPVFAWLHGLPVVQTWHEYFQTSGVSWPNLVACKALICARPDLKEKMPFWAKMKLRNTPQIYVANASSIPVPLLSEDQIYAIKNRLSGGKPMVCYFGFAHINKGMERLFEIADPQRHYLVLICELSDKNEYQAEILRLMSAPPWKGNAASTGFLLAEQVGEILAASDAIVFPFPDGAGEWNTTLKAAQATGNFSLATTKDEKRIGYNENENTYFASCDSLSDMRTALQEYLGRKHLPSKENDWERISSEHERIYRGAIENK